MKTLLLFLFPLVLAAQQTTLRGVVAVFNSKFETGQTVYVANAQVEEEFQRSQATTTMSDGTFSLALVGIKARWGFTFRVWKPDFEVVNTDQLRAIAGQRDAVSRRTFNGRAGGDRPPRPGRQLIPPYVRSAWQPGVPSGA